MILFIKAGSRQGVSTSLVGEEKHLKVTNWATGNKEKSHVILKDDDPYEAQDDGRFTIEDVRNVYVD